MECRRYEKIAFPKESNYDRLNWWKMHESEFPLLSKCAKYILAIPASSATSERIFSAGGLTVTNLRSSLDESKVEDILNVRLNLPKVENYQQVFASKNKKRCLSECSRKEEQPSQKRQRLDSALETISED